MFLFFFVVAFLQNLIRNNRNKLNKIVHIGLAEVYNDDLENDDNDDDFEADEHEGETDSDLAEEEEGEDEGNSFKFILIFCTRIIRINYLIFQKNHQLGEPKESTKAKKTITMVNSMHAIESNLSTQMIHTV